MAKVTPEKIAELKERFEQAVREANPEFLIGVDEVGFGSIAGPIMIGAVGVPVDWKPPVGLTDSKDLTRKQVAKLAGEFLASDVSGVYHFVVSMPAEAIDTRGLGRVRRGCLTDGIEFIRACYPGRRTLAIVDGNLNLGDSVSIPKADLIVPVVSMAAVIAKYTRDVWMIAAAEEFPGYGFESHVGYDTTKHREAIRHLGPCKLHRMSTNTLKDLTRA